MKLDLLVYKPMLASNADIDKIQYPVYASPKLDGIRATIQYGKVYSRTGKLIPNKNIQELYGKSEYEGFDGELIYGDPTSHDVFKDTTSVVMSHDRTPDKLMFYVFDDVTRGNIPYSVFMDHFEILNGKTCDKVHFHLPTLITCKEELDKFEEETVSKGYEGVVLRSLDSPYKHGRSTVKEGYLLKIKRFTDGEAEIIGITPLYHPNIDMYDTERIGSLEVRTKDGVEFSIGSGFTDVERSFFKVCPPIGQLVKFKYFTVGMQNKPRFPIFLGIRDKEDIEWD